MVETPRRCEERPSAVGRSESPCPGIPRQLRAITAGGPAGARWSQKKSYALCLALATDAASARALALSAQLTHISTSPVSQGFVM